LILTNSIHQFKSDDSKNGQQVTGAAGANFDNEDAVEVEVESQNNYNGRPNFPFIIVRNLKFFFLIFKGRAFLFSLDIRSYLMALLALSPCARLYKCCLSYRDRKRPAIFE
jgi:hypothetical protein